MHLTDTQRDALDKLPATGGVLPKQIGCTGNTLARLARKGLAWAKYFDGARYYGITDAGRYERGKPVGEVQHE